jgi:hypothetical protein
VIEAEVRSVQEWTPQFVVTVDQAVKVVSDKREFMKRVMVEGTHYGTIPGAGTKPVLLLPGAQTLSSSMALHPVFGDAAPPIEDWTGKDHLDAEGKPEPFLLYRRYCELRRQTGIGPQDYMVIARAEGSCSSWESKYRYRTAGRVCPNCGKGGFLFKSKPPRKGFYCWNKPDKGKDGCGAEFREDDKRILEQKVGRVANPDVLDQANTILKMADKRAYIAATLQATGCADLFTQDLEDGVGDAPGDDEPPPPEGPSLADAMKSNGKEVNQPSAETPSTPAASDIKRTPSSEAKSPSPAATPTAPGTSGSPTATSTRPSTESTPSVATPSTASSSPAASPSEPEQPTFGGELNPQLQELKTKAYALAKEATIKTNKARFPNQDFPAALVDSKTKNAVESYLKLRRQTTSEAASAEDWTELIAAINVTLNS